MSQRQPVSLQSLLGEAATPATWPTAREHLEGSSATYWLATVRPGRHTARPGGPGRLGGRWTVLFAQVTAPAKPRTSPSTRVAP
jgi:hypothetical protein